MTGSPEPREHGPRVPEIRPGGQGRSRARVSWSTGKDSAYALRLAQADRRIEVLGLFTTVDEDAGTVACNGCRSAWRRLRRSRSVFPFTS